MKNIAAMALVTLISASSFGYGHKNLIRSFRLDCTVESNIDTQVHQLSITRTLLELVSGSKPVSRSIETRVDEVGEASFSKSLLGIYNQAQEPQSTVAELTDPAFSIFEGTSDLALETDIPQFSTETFKFAGANGVLVSYQDKKSIENDFIPLQSSFALQQLQTLHYELKANLAYKIFNREQPLKSLSGLMKLTGTCVAR